MKVLVYWVIGCILVGAAVAEQDRRCPSGKSVGVTQLVALVAIWPVSVGFWLDGGAPEKTCPKGPSL